MTTRRRLRFRGGVNRHNLGRGYKSPQRGRQRPFSLFPCLGSRKSVMAAGDLPEAILGRIHAEDPISGERNENGGPSGRATGGLLRDRTRARSERINPQRVEYQKPQCVCERKEWGEIIEGGVRDSLKGKEGGEERGGKEGEKPSSSRLHATASARASSEMGRIPRGGAFRGCRNFWDVGAWRAWISAPRLLGFALKGISDYFLMRDGQIQYSSH